MALTKATYGMISADTSTIDLNIDANTLYVDSSANRVGIGTTSPTTKLDVAGGIGASSSSGSTAAYSLGWQNNSRALEMRYDSSYYMGIEMHAQTRDLIFNNKSGDNAGDIRFFTGSTLTEKFTILADGKVGIGLSNPSHILDVTGDKDTWISKIYNSGSDANAQGLLVRSDATGSHDAMVLGVYAHNAYRMVVKSTGNVGIGTTSPSKELDVLGTIRATDNTDEHQLRPTQIISYGTDAILNAQSTGDDVRLNTQGTTRLIATAEGNVGIGTASPDAPLTVHSSSDPEIRVGYSSSQDHRITWDSAKLFLEADPDNGVSNSALGFRVDGSEAGRFDASGNLLIGQTAGNVYNQSSVSGFKLDGANGNLQIARSGNTTAFFNRLTSDGTIVDFRKNGTSVGSIGTVAGDIVIGTGACGIRFHDGTPAIQPRNTNGNANNDAIDIGLAGNRFKDLHLSGIASIGNLKIGTDQGTDGQLLTSTGSGIAWEDAPAGGPTFKTFGTDSIMIGDTTTGTINNANKNVGLGVNVFESLTTGDNNVAVGYDALNSLESQGGNVAIGYQAGKSVVSGWENIFIGLYAGINAVHREAIAIGSYSMYSNTGTTNGDIAIGLGAIQYKNATLGNTIAIGTYAHRGGNTTTGRSNIAIGPYAMQAITTGTYNTAVGDYALNGITTGTFNVAMGQNALASNTTGTQNIGIGRYAMQANTSASHNTAVGTIAMYSNTTGTENTAFGSGALYTNTTSNFNTAVGKGALNLNTAGNNTAVGHEALKVNTTGSQNTAIGAECADAITTGANNTAVGYEAMGKLTTGFDNVAMGRAALLDTTSGAGNVAIGVEALENNTASENVAVGKHSLRANTSGASNAAVGFNALNANTTGGGNTAIGSQALDANTTADHNTAVGFASMTSTTTGTQNTAVGSVSFQQNTTGQLNTAIGYAALNANTTGSKNSAVGNSALGANTTGYDNVAMGRSSLDANTTGYANVAIGESSLTTNTTGYRNTAVGQNTLAACSTGLENTAIGQNAANDVTTGSYNVVVGQNALSTCTTGNSNIAIGVNALDALTDGGANVAVGLDAGTDITDGNTNALLGYRAGYNITEGSNNTCIGTEAGKDVTTAGNSVLIGHDAGSDALGSISTTSNYIMLGNNSITNFEAKVGLTVGSDSRDKTDIETLPTSAGLNFVKQMRPVTYVWDNRDNYYPHTHEKYGERDHSKKDTDKQVGFIAQEIKEIEKSIGWTEDHIVNTKNPESYKVMYEQLIPILVKAIQELEAEVQALKGE